MTKDEFLNEIKTIGSSEDPANMRAMLAELQNKVSSDYDALETSQNEVTRLTNDNESLRAANMKMFLSIGETKSDAEIRKGDTGSVGSEPKPPRKFEDLFNEKGGLK